jgi:ribonuclease-3
MSQYPAPIQSLEATIGYTFNDTSIIKKALTHSSYANEQKVHTKKIKTDCNERLEFLGDSVLSIIVSEHLFIENKYLPEGELTKLRAELVCEKALSKYAFEIGLGEYMYLGNGEEKNNGRNRQSTLENVFEAIVAAIYLDAGEHGFDEVKKMVLPIIKSQLSDDNFAINHTDAKTELQQLVQQAEGDFLEYITVGESGPDHNKTFRVEARLNSNIIGRGEGRSKREAEQNAAMEALRLFGEV